MALLQACSPAPSSPAISVDLRRLRSLLPHSRRLSGGDDFRGPLRLHRAQSHPRTILVKLVVQLIHLRSGPVESPSPGCRDRIRAPPAPASTIFCARPQQSSPFQSVQQRVKRARPDPIPMVPQLLLHRQPEDRLLRGVRQHVDSNQAVKEFLSLVRHTVQYNRGHQSRPANQAQACLRLPTLAAFRAM